MKAMIYSGKGHLLFEFRSKCSACFFGHCSFSSNCLIRILLDLKISVQLSVTYPGSLYRAVNRRRLEEIKK